MKRQRHGRQNKGLYLDVSEFIVKHFSPVIKPVAHPEPVEIVQNPQQFLVPEVSPVIEGKMHFTMTPLFGRSKSDPLHDIPCSELDDFCLDAGNGDDRRNTSKSKGQAKSRPRIASLYYHSDDSLQNIIEENNGSDGEHSSDPYVRSHELLQVQSDDEEQFGVVTNQQAEKQSATNFDCLSYEFRCPEWQVANPKKQLASSLKEIVSDGETKGVEAKFGKIKQTIARYLCEYEFFYFEESMSQIRRTHSEPREMVDTILQGLEQTFSKSIGGLPFEKRRVKLLRYLDKKKRRVWRKKINYNCRKKVADGRLRIKGKFVTHEQACERLGLPSLDGYTPEEIKQRLYQQLEQC